MADLSLEQFSAAVLQKLGVRQTPGAMQAMVGWAKAEGGHFHNGARYNPLNTTQPEPGAGNTGSQGNIKVYTSWQQGIDATVKTLRNGRYDTIINALKSGNPGKVANAIGQTPWGTSGGLVRSTIMGTKPTTVALPSPAPAQAPVGQAPVGQPNVDRQAALQNYLTQRGRPGALLGLAGQLGAAAPTAAPAATTTAPTAAPSTPGGAGAALGWATSKIGFKETGTNSGGLASYANSRFGMSNQPWCAMFTSLAVTKGGAPSSARSASVADVLAKAQRGDGYVKGFVDPHTAQAGDLIAFGTSHIGMVESVKGGQITMVAGNDSDGVQRRTVPIGGGIKVVRPKYA